MHSLSLSAEGLKKGARPGAHEIMAFPRLQSLFLLPLTFQPAAAAAEKAPKEKRHLNGRERDKKKAKVSAQLRR